MNCATGMVSATRGTIATVSCAAKRPATAPFQLSFCIGYSTLSVDGRPRSAPELALPLCWRRTRLGQRTARGVPKDGEEILGGFPGLGPRPAEPDRPATGRTARILPA